MSNVLHSRAMLANLSITGWSARKLDRKITDETNALHGAAADAGRYNKALIAGNALAKIVAISSAARNLHYSMTLAWSDTGARILPAAIYDNYSRAMRENREAYEAAVSEFVSDYPDYVQQARKRLNGMFRESDYPSAADIERKFSFGVTLLPVPDASDFRVDMADEQVTFIREEIEKHSAAALQTAMRDVWTRISETVGHMADKLAAFKPAAGKGDKAEGIFRDSLVENVRELVGILPALNITNDPALAAVVERMERELLHVTPDTLRESAWERGKVRDAANDILKTVSDFL